MMDQPNSRRPRRGGKPKPTVEPPARYTALLLEALIAYRKDSTGRTQQEQLAASQLARTLMPAARTRSPGDQGGAPLDGEAAS